MSKKHVDIKWMLNKGLREIEPGVWGIPPKNPKGGQQGGLKQAVEPVLHDKPVRVSVKPMSVNLAYKGRRYRTKEYDAHEKNVFSMLPKLIIPEPPYHIYFKFCFSTTNADCDNPLKIQIDLLQKFYNFNDRNVYKLTVEKTIVPKGHEYFEFMILPYEPETINK